MPETFGPYRLESLLGRGGMGEVCRATDTRRDRVVALKRLLPDLGDRAAEARFVREQQLTARLQSPHVIPIHDFGTIDGRLFLDMRFVRGEDLGNEIARGGAMSANRAVTLVDQVGEALDEAHSAGYLSQSERVC